MELTIDKAKFSVYTDSDDYAEELGDSVWVFSYREVRRVCKKLRSFAKSRASRDIEAHLDECEEENEPDELGEASFCVSIPDEAIVIIAAMIHLGGEWSLNYQGGSSEYWFHHDMWHAQYDVSVDDRDGMVTMQIDEGAEMAAVLGGAENAKEHDVSIADIARELVNIEKAWPDRFGGEQFFLEDFLNS